MNNIKQKSEVSSLISQWLSNMSIEQTTIEIDKLVSLQAGRKIYIVHFPDKSFKDNIEAARKVIDRGLKPVLHIAARNIKDKVELQSILKDVHSAKVDEMLILGGGINTQAGEFKTAHDLLKTGYFEDNGVRNFGIALHPEKHPYATEEEILEGYQLKYDYLSSRKLNIYGMSQFCFAVERILEMVDYLKKHQLNIPVEVGVVGKSSFLKLIKYSLLCGVGNSINVLKKEASNISKMAVGYNPDQFILPLANAIINKKEYELIKGLHLFPFGNLEATLEHFDKKDK